MDTQQYEMIRKNLLGSGDRNIDLCFLSPQPTGQPTGEDRFQSKRPRQSQCDAGRALTFEVILSLELDFLFRTLLMSIDT